MRRFDNPGITRSVACLCAVLVWGWLASIRAEERSAQRSVPPTSGEGAGVESAAGTGGGTVLGVPEGFPWPGVEWLPEDVRAGVRFHLGAGKRVEQSSRQIFPTGLGSAWYAEFSGASAGYVIRGELGWELGFSGVQGDPVISGPDSGWVPGVPNLQQFPVSGRMARRVASGCVPTAAGNLLGFWRGRLKSGRRVSVDLANGSGEVAPDAGEDTLRELTLAVRSRLEMHEFRDEAGYTEDGMPLAGAYPGELVHALGAVAREQGMELKAELLPFDFGVYRSEIGQGRPVLLSCVVRLPHKPHLSWGHEVLGVGWGRWQGAEWVLVRDNFFPPGAPDQVRLLPSKGMGSMVVVRP